MNRKVFFDHVRAKIFGSFSQDQVDGLNTLLDVIEGWDLRWQAYALATAYGETARTMQPIAEYGKGRGRKYGKPVAKHGGQVAYGRGYVQLTWDYNYAKADQKLNLSGALIGNYELAMDPTIAAKIMRRGMEEGWFTGKALKHYFNDKKTDWRNARRIINGTDRAAKYAAWAKHFHRALIAAHDPQNSLPRTGEPQPVAIVCMGTNDWAYPRGVQGNTEAVIDRLRSAGIEPVVVLPVKTKKILDARLEVQAAVSSKAVRMYDPDPASDGIHMTTKEAARINEEFRPSYFVGDSNAVRVAMAVGQKYPHAKVGEGSDWIRRTVERSFRPKSVQNPTQTVQEKPNKVNWLTALLELIFSLFKRSK